mgnify:CR=1 FL=1
MAIIADNEGVFTDIPLKFLPIGINKRLGPNIGFKLIISSYMQIMPPSACQLKVITQLRLVPDGNSNS